MQRVILFCFLWLMMLTTVHADVDYKLHDVSAEEYINAIATSSPINDYSALNIIQTQLTTDYANTAWSDFDLIVAAYNNFENRPRDTIWIPMKVVSWLNSRSVTLLDGIDITIDEATVHVTAIDVDENGQDEWMLNYSSDDIIFGLLFIKLNEEGHYISIPQPLSYSYASYGKTESPQILDIQDFTQDDSVDIAVLNRIEGEYSTVERLYILSLQDDQFMDVSNDTFNHEGSESQWDILNLDDDRTLEIQQTASIQDNWGCYGKRITSFDWQGDHFYVEKEYMFADHKHCNLRLAEEAIWSGDFDTAIKEYQDYLASETYPQQYASFRLGIALTLNGQIDQGINVLRRLKAEQAGQVNYTLLPLVTQILDTYTENPNPTAICLSAYDYFVFNAYTAWFNESLEVGYVIDNIIYGQGMHSPLIPLPERAGCDFPTMLDVILADTKFTSDRSPVEQLADVNIITDITFQDDLNQDGIQDWIVWMPTIRISPILFLSDDENYVLSRPYISDGYPLNQVNSLSTIYLPDGQVALLNVDYSVHYQTPSLAGGLGGGPGNCQASGVLEIWERTGQEFTSIFQSLLCEQTQPLNTVDNTNEVNTVYGWAFNRKLDDYAPVTYVWDTTNQSFIIPVDLKPNFESSRPKYATHSPISLYKEQDFKNLFNYHAEAIATISESSDPLLLEWRYVTALALKEQGRDDEAIAEFRAVYIATPESLWGLLSSLYFEVEEP